MKERNATGSHELGPVREDEFLYQLVQRLDKEEFNFVKENLLQPKFLDALRLLQDLRKQSEYNRNLLKPKYNDLEKVKNQLRVEILPLLRLFHHQKESAEQQISNYLLNEQILYRKGLYEHAEKELKKAQSVAEDHQRLGRLLEILQLKQYRIVERTKKNLWAKTRVNLDYLVHVLDMYSDQMRAFVKHQERFVAYRISGEREPEVDPIAIREEFFPWPPADFYLRLYQNSLLSLEAQLAGDIALAVDIARDTVAMFEASREIRLELQVNYKIQLANLGVMLVAIDAFSEVRTIIDKLNALESKNLNEEAETWQNVIHLELMLMLDSLNFEGQTNLISRVEQGLEHYRAKINGARLLSILFNLLMLYLINENFSMANKTMKSILAHHTSETRREVQYSTRLLGLLISYELDGGNPSESQTVAVRRYLVRKNKLMNFRRTVVLHLERLVRSDAKKRRDILTSLNLVLSGYQDAPNHPDHLGLLIVRAWVCSRLSNGKLRIKDCI